MNNGIIERFNACVKPEDETYHLGDFSLSEKVVPLILPRLSGKHILIRGNHDSCHPIRKGYEAATRRYLMYGFSGVYQELRNVHGFTLAHMPYSGDHTIKERYSEYRPKDDGGWLLCGHVHDAWKINGRQINVGVDVWDWRPVQLETLIAIRDANQ